MQPLAIVLGAVAAVAIGGVILLLIERARLKQAVAVASSERDSALGQIESLNHLQDDFDTNLAEARERLTSLSQDNTALTTRLEVLQKNSEEQLDQVQQHYDELRKADREMIEEVKEKLYETFSASAGKATRESLDQFLKTAQETFDKSREKTAAEIKLHVTPIAETLKKTDEKIGELEKQRLGAYERLNEQIKAIAQNHAELRTETGNLVAALRKPQVRGRYGEIQLQRVAELAGMESYCDFDSQASSRDDAGKLLRPDMVVKLPNGRAIAVDAKTNIEAYIDAIESDTPEDQEHNLDRFARHVAEQATALSKKDYWTRVDGNFDFVVMFIPGDQFIDAALERRPQLLDLAATQKIILASPSTLIGLLRAVFVGWREKTLSDSAQELFKLGRELHERTAVALEHAAKVGHAINTAATSYNAFVGSVDSRLMPTLRRFEDKGATSARQIEAQKEVDVQVRPIHALPMVEPGAEPTGMGMSTDPASD